MWGNILKEGTAGIGFLGQNMLDGDSFLLHVIVYGRQGDS